MTSINDGKDVKSNQPSGQRGKLYYIELYKSLDGRLSGECDLHSRTRNLCEAWRRVHALCLHALPATHPHLLSWLQRHTARTILQTEWQSPKSKDEHTSLEEAIDAFVAESKSGLANKDGVRPPWEIQLQQRAEWFRRILGNPWGHDVLRALLDTQGPKPGDEEILAWLKEERGVMFVTRLRQLAASKCDDLAMSLVTAVMDRVRATTELVPDNDQNQDGKEKDKAATLTDPTSFAYILTTEAGFTSDVWEVLTDIEFVLLHKGDRHSKCIELAKQTPLKNGYQLVERLQSRLEVSPREKKLWKNAKEVATLVAQVIIARCMVVPICAGVCRVALYGCARSLVRLVSARALPAAAAALAAPAATARHLHTLAQAVHSQCGSSMKPFVCELYVRAITAGMNELERLKLKTEKEPEARSAEQLLASWFVQLGALLAGSERVRCECALTAFSVHPSRDMYDLIRDAPPLPSLQADTQDTSEETTSEFGSWTTDSRTQSNLVKTSETLNIKHTQNQANVLSTALLTEGEAIGLSPELCQDLAVLLSGPRVKTLSWDMDREALLENCRAYMERTHAGTRALTTELKYLNLDPASYMHLPEEDDDENNVYYGIEKGYEHLVELPDPDEALQEIDFEETESAHSSCMELEYAPVRRKKKTKRAPISSSEDDPLSLVAEGKRTEKKKERPHSKERSNKEPKERKKKTKPKANTEDKEGSREGRSDNPENTEKKKEKKPRKKKEKKQEVEQIDMSMKPGSLSSLIGMKVAKIKIPEGKYKKSTCTKLPSSCATTDSDYDSQGKSSLASLNSEGNDPDVLFDGLFCMDDYRSPENDPLAERSLSNSELNIANGKVSMVGAVDCKPETNHNFCQTFRNNHPKPATVTSANASNHDPNTPKNVNAVREEVKKSISRLIEFRRQKNLLEESQRNSASSSGSASSSPSVTCNNSPITPAPTAVPTTAPTKAPTTYKPKAIIRPDFPDLPLITSPKALAVPEIPKLYINKKQVEQIKELKSEVDTILNTKYPKPVIQYANKYMQQPFNYSDAYLQSVLQPERVDPPVQHRPTPQYTTTNSRDTVSQKCFQNFLKELSQSINAGTGKKEIKPQSRVTPVDPKKPSSSSQCAKSTIQTTKKVDNQLNTFSRLSYMHKAKQSELNNALIQDQLLNKTLEEQKKAKLKYLQSKGDIVISRVGQTPQNLSTKDEAKVLIQRVEKTPRSSAIAEHPMLANMLQLKNTYNNTQGAVHKEVTKQENPARYVPQQLEFSRTMTPAPNHPSAKESALGEKDQSDLLKLRHQQNKLNYPLNVDKQKITKTPEYPYSSVSSTTPNYNQMTSGKSNMTKNYPAEIKNNNTHSQQYDSSANTLPFESVKNVCTNPVVGNTGKVNKSGTTKKVNATLVKVPNVPPSYSEMTSSIPEHRDVKSNNSEECPNWLSVMNALLKHKTPSRGPNALDMALQKDSFQNNSLRNQRITRTNTAVNTQVKTEEKSQPQTPIIAKHVMPNVIQRRVNTAHSALIEAKLKKQNPPSVKTEIIKNPIQPEQSKRQVEVPKKSVATELTKEKDPFISGIPNADYDIIEELIDDALRREIGEISSDEEVARDYPTLNVKGNKPVSAKLTNTIKNITTQQEKSQAVDLRCGAKSAQDSRNIAIPSNNQSKCYNAPKTVINSGITQQIPKNTVGNTKPVSNEPKVSKIPASNVQQCQRNIVQQPTTTMISSNIQTNEQPYICQNVSANRISIVDSSNVIITAVPQPVIPNMVLLGSEYYDPYAVQAQLQPGLCTVRQSPYVTVNTAPNITVYQTTQFAAPIVNEVIIGNAMTVPMSTPVSENVTTTVQAHRTQDIIRNSQQNLNTQTEVNQECYRDSLLGNGNTGFQKDVHAPVAVNKDCYKDCILVNKNKDKNVLLGETNPKQVIDPQLQEINPVVDPKSSVDVRSRSQDVGVEHPSVVDPKPSLDINSNKNCERKVLSEVQDKQPILTEKIDPKNIKNQKLPERDKVETNIHTEIKNLKEPKAHIEFVPVKSLKDQERLRKKRLAILNRQVSHQSVAAPIPLEYSPLIKPIQGTIVNIKAPQNKVDEQPKTIDENDTDNSKENQDKSIPCRRILLRSSNDLKITVITSHDQTKPVGRKTKVRLKKEEVQHAESTAQHKGILDATTNEEKDSPKRVSKRIQRKQENEQILAAAANLNVDSTATVETKPPQKKIINKKQKVLKKDVKIVENVETSQTIKKTGLVNVVDDKNKSKVIEKTNVIETVTPDAPSVSDFSGIDIEDALLGAMIPKNFLATEKKPPINDEPTVKQTNNKSKTKRKKSISALKVTQDEIIIPDAKLPSDSESLNGGVYKREEIPSKMKISTFQLDQNDKIVDTPFFKNVDSLLKAASVVGSTKDSVVLDTENKPNIRAATQTEFGKVPTVQVHENKIILENKFLTANKHGTRNANKRTMVIKDKNISESYAPCIGDLIKKSTIIPVTKSSTEDGNKSNVTPIIIPSSDDLNKKSDTNTKRLLKSVPNADTESAPELSNKEIGNKFEMRPLDAPKKSEMDSATLNTNTGNLKELVSKDISSAPHHTTPNVVSEITKPQNSVHGDNNGAQNKKTGNQKPSLPVSSNAIINDQTTNFLQSTQATIDSWKDKIAIEELPSTNEPNKKCVRIKLPNGKTFKATVFGKMHVSYESLFSNPALRSALLNNVNDSKRYTVNIKQISTAAKHDPSKIVDTRIEEVSVRSTKKNDAIETVNLLSDDEDEVCERKLQILKTEFGEFKISLKEDDFNKHKNKLQQKSVIKLTDIKKVSKNDKITKKNISENLIDLPLPTHIVGAEKITPGKLNGIKDASSDTQILPEKKEALPIEGPIPIAGPISISIVEPTPNAGPIPIAKPVSIANPIPIAMTIAVANPATPVPIEKTIHVAKPVPIEKSTPVAKPIAVAKTVPIEKPIHVAKPVPIDKPIPVAKPVPIEKSIPEVIEIDDSSNDSTYFDSVVKPLICDEHTLRNKILEGLSTPLRDTKTPTKEIYELKNLLLKDLGVDLSSDAEKPKPNDTSPVIDDSKTEAEKPCMKLPKCFVKLQNCDDLVVKYEKIRIMNQKCTVDLVRCDDQINIGRVSSKDENELNISDDLINIDIDAVNVSEPKLTRSGSFSLLEDFSICDEKRLENITQNEYDRSSPVMEAYDTISTLRKASQAKKMSLSVMEIFDIIASLKKPTEAKKEFFEIECSCDWFATKRDFHSSSRVKLEQPKIDNIPLFYESTFNSFKMQSDVPSLKTLTAKLLQDGSIIDQLKPYLMCVNPIQSPSQKLKRKLRNGEDKVACKLLKVMFATTQDIEVVEGEKVCEQHLPVTPEYTVTVQDTDMTQDGDATQDTQTLQDTVMTQDTVTAQDTLRVEDKLRAEDMIMIQGAVTPQDKVTVHETVTAQDTLTKPNNMIIAHGTLSSSEDNFIIQDLLIGLVDMVTAQVTAAAQDTVTAKYPLTNMVTAQDMVTIRDTVTAQDTLTKPEDMVMGQDTFTAQVTVTAEDTLTKPENIITAQDALLTPEDTTITEVTLSKPEDTITTQDALSDTEDATIVQDLLLKPKDMILAQNTLPNLEKTIITQDALTDPEDIIIAQVTLCKPDDDSTTQVALIIPQDIILTQEPSHSYNTVTSQNILTKRDENALLTGNALHDTEVYKKSEMKVESTSNTIADTSPDMFDSTYQPTVLNVDDVSNDTITLDNSNKKLEESGQVTISDKYDEIPYQNSGITSDNDSKIDETKEELDVNTTESITKKIVDRNASESATTDIGESITDDSSSIIVNKAIEESVILLSDDCQELVVSHNIDEHMSPSETNDRSENLETTTAARIDPVIQESVSLTCDESDITNDCNQQVTKNADKCENQDETDDTMINPSSETQRDSIIDGILDSKTDCASNEEENFTGNATENVNVNNLEDVVDGKNKQNEDKSNLNDSGSIIVTENYHENTVCFNESGVYSKNEQNEDKDNLDDSVFIIVPEYYQEDTVDSIASCVNNESESVRNDLISDVVTELKSHIDDSCIVCPVDITQDTFEAQNQTTDLPDVNTESKNNPKSLSEKTSPEAKSESINDEIVVIEDDEYNTIHTKNLGIELLTVVEIEPNYEGSLDSCDNPTEIENQRLVDDVLKESECGNKNEEEPVEKVIVIREKSIDSISSQNIEEVIATAKLDNTVVEDENNLDKVPSPCIKHDKQLSVQIVDPDVLKESCANKSLEEILNESVSSESIEKSSFPLSLIQSKLGNELVLNGIEYEDPVAGTCYVFPIVEQASSSFETDDNDMFDDEPEEIIQVIQEIGEDGTVGKVTLETKEITPEEYFTLNIPNLTYSKNNSYTHNKSSRRQLKRKIDMSDIRVSEKKYRKGKNIDYPKITAAAMLDSAYSKEFKRIMGYYSSLKFSYSQSFHQEFIDVEDILKNWPLGESYSDDAQGEVESDILFSDLDNSIDRGKIFNPIDQSLAEELSVEYSDIDLPPNKVAETNFNMGFGEGSDRVLQNLEDVGDDSKFSAATLSDVKQPQPFLQSEDYDENKTDDKTKDQLKQLRRHFTYIQMRDKVRSFFKNSIVELKYDWLKQEKARSDISDVFSFPFHLYNATDFIEPKQSDLFVQVVQVGQLPVSAAAQNPVTCDPRVTQVSNASPSQCSVDNSPQDDSQPAIKTEYTELTTADLSIPLMQEYAQHTQSFQIDSQEPTNMTMTDENIPIETEIKSVVKIELMEEPEEKDEHQETYENCEQQNLEHNHVNNVEYSFDTNSTDVSPPLEPEPDYQTMYNSPEKQNITESYPPQEEPKQQNGAPEKTDQIAHAMNAAGITTTSETMTTTRAHALVNILSQKLRQTPVAPTQTPTNTYSKTTSINAMALQQALAQILPPPLNQTNSTENNQQQVLHIVQGKNASGSQITLVDNSQQSVINAPNATPVLHIVQNKTGTANATSNGAATPHNNSFGGLSLVDTGLQQGGNQLLHIVNTGGQKANNATGQLLKRVNLLTNLANVQGSNEQKMVQFVCKSADGKAIQLNAPHQRSMVLRLQPIETPNVQAAPAKPENQDLSPTSNAANSLPGKDSASQQEIKSRSVYEENYAKFIQNSSSKTTVPEKATSLPKFNQAFGKPVFQDGSQNQNDLNTNNSHLSVNTKSEPSECQANDNAINLDHIGQISSPPLLLRKSPAQTSQNQANLVQQLKQTITPMNIQTMHGGVIYTRQIPVNIGGGQTINLITVPSTELVDDSVQKQPTVGAQNDIEQSIIKIVPQNQTATNTEITSEDGSASMNVANEANQTPQPQPVLTQMRIKLPMLSKAPQMVSGARVVRPSFFQIQRNVIGGTNQPVYQQLVLTAAPPLGQQTIRLPQTQTTRQIKVPTDSQSSAESQMSSSTLEQLREFDMVLEQVKERSSVPPNSNANTTFPKLHTPSSDTTDCSSASSTSTESTQQVLYSIGNNHQPLNVAYVNRKAAVATPTTSTFVRSPDSSGIVDSTSSSHVQIPHTVTTDSTNTDTPAPKPKLSSKSKSRPKASSNPPSNLKINTVPPKTSAQKPLEDEQTTQRILYILAEYKEQVENSPDKDKPAPRRRSNPPSNPSGSSKRKKSSSGSRRGTRELSPMHGEDTCRTMGSEDSSCGTSQGDCNESCMESYSPQDSPRKVVRKLTFEQETPAPTPRPQPQRNVIVADGQTITVARGTAGKPATAVLMPANYILPVSMVKGGQQIAIVTNRGPKLLTVGGGEAGATNALLLQRLIGPAGLKPVLARPGVRHVRLPTAALHNLQAFNLATATTIHPPDSTASPAPAPTPPELVDTRATSSPWTDREDVKPERGSSPEGSEPWNLPSSGDPHDYSYEETVRADNLDRTVLVVQKKDGSSHRQHRLTHVSAAALRHKYAILEHELRLQKSLSEECEDLGVDSPSASELFPEAELLFATSPAHEHNQDHGHHSHTPQPVLLNQSGIPHPDMDDQIATDQLLSRSDVTDDQRDLNLGLEDVGIVTVSEDGMQATIALDQEEFARSHPNTTFHSEPEEGEMQPFTIAGLKGRHITSTIFHSNRAPATVLMTAPHTTVISQATADHHPPSAVKHTYSDIDNMINSLPSANGNNINLSSVLVKDEGLTRFDSILNDSRELHLSNTASAIVHSAGNATQVIRRVCYDDDKRDNRFLMDEPDALIAGDDAKMIAEDNSSRDATMESMVGDVDDDRSSPERHAELFWESNSASERSESRRPMDFSSDSEKCCKSPSYDETNSTDSSGVGTHMRLDSVIKDARGLERSASADGSSADDTHPPLRTYPPKRMYHPIDGEMERSLSGKTRAGERSPDSLEVRRRASGRGVVKRGCHCCNGSPAPPRPKKPRQRKPTMDFTSN